MLDPALNLTRVSFLRHRERPVHPICRAGPKLHRLLRRKHLYHYNPPVVKPLSQLTFQSTRRDLNGYLPHPNVVGKLKLGIHDGGLMFPR